MQPSRAIGEGRSIGTTQLEIHGVFDDAPGEENTHRKCFLSPLFYTPL
jgi:hypothetical protein